MVEWEKLISTAFVDPYAAAHPGQHYRDADGNSLRKAVTHGVRTWGNHPEGSSVFLVGAYEHLSDISDRLLRALPPALTVARADWDSPLVPHDKPAHPWSMASLASESGASRASLARRFHDLVDEPPMTFLRNWRMALATDLLCQPGETVGTVAQKVGYATLFAFSAAFKRVWGVSPQKYRESAR